MPVQKLALLFFIVLGLIIILTFVYFYRSTKKSKPEEDYYKKVSSVRFPFFIFLVVFLGAFLIFTLGYVPYPKKGVSPDKIIMVDAMMFNFILTQAGKEEPETFLQIPAGSLVEFRVTSKDVNHGFGVYSPEGVLLGQVQAMPGYVNRLLLRLDKPGTYRILCMEYCGLSHYIMQASFEVIPQTPNREGSK